MFFTSFRTAEGWKWGRVPYRQTRPEEANFDLAKSQISCSWIIRSWFKSIETSFLCVWGGLLISSLEQSLKLCCDSGIENEGSPCNGWLVEVQCECVFNSLMWISSWIIQAQDSQGFPLLKCRIPVWKTI